MIFQTIEEIDLFLEELKDRKVTTTKKWTLAQILCHIGDSIEFFLSQNEGAIQVPGFIQNTVEKLLLTKFFLFGKMDASLTNPIYCIVPITFLISKCLKIRLIKKNR